MLCGCVQTDLPDREMPPYNVLYLVWCVQDLTASLVARVQTAPSVVIEELKARLSLKEKLFQELLSDRSRQSNEHHAQVQDLLNTISSKDQYLQVFHHCYWMKI